MFCLVMKQSLPSWRAMRVCCRHYIRGLFGNSEIEEYVSSGNKAAVAALLPAESFCKLLYNVF